MKLDDFPIIEEPKKYLHEKVHVDGWNIACVFVLKETDGVTHKLITPKYKKEYITTNKLRRLRGK